ncbi:hypothetical protein WJX73_006465 [Symbiochloris irregularis]|uniref:F-box domain-containing protein n=1 Tax=Symbiochloris irregularis TaxID=706552 RepID=A0AAW1NEL6_9CHLO
MQGAPLPTHQSSAGSFLMANSTISLTDIGGVLPHMILPLLAAKDLACLSCTTKELRGFVYDSPAPVWEAAARRLLPKSHPLGQALPRSRIQAALQTYSDSMRNIGSGTCTQERKAASEVSFNATGSHLAILLEDCVKIYDAETFERVTVYKKAVKADTAMRTRSRLKGLSAGPRVAQSNFAMVLKSPGSGDTLRLHDIADVLQHVVLPSLHVRDLAALACTSKDCRALVYDAPDLVWEAAARDFLPAAHPLSKHAARSTFQAALAAFSTAGRNARAGKHTTRAFNA